VLLNNGYFDAADVGNVKEVWNSVREYLRTEVPQLKSVDLHEPLDDETTRLILMAGERAMKLASLMELRRRLNTIQGLSRISRGLRIINSYYMAGVRRDFEQMEAYDEALLDSVGAILGLLPQKSFSLLDS